MFDALLTNLSKAFDCLNHELFIAKLNAYDFSLTALKLVHNYLSNWKQRSKINSTYSSLLEIIFGLPQELILGPILFNICLIDLFFIIEDTDIASYANDNTPYFMADNVYGVIKSLEEASEILFKWFNDNLMKINADKCHLSVSANNTVKIKIGNFDITNNRSEKPLGVKFDHKLSLDDHISKLCKKASRKIHTLSRVASYVNILKRRILMNTFFKSQFSYCPLVWMCHSCVNNGKTNRLHERCLRIIYSDKQPSFKTLLKKDGSVSVYSRNLQILATEMYKTKNDLSPLIVTELSEQKNKQHYALRKNSHFTIPPVRTVYHGSERILFLGPKI